MRDDVTSSEWLHYTGECIAGPLAGRSLEMFSTLSMSWAAFQQAYPGCSTIPLAREWWRRLSGRLIGSRRMKAFLPKYFRDTMKQTDTRLPDGELGIGVFLGKRSLLSHDSVAGARFYPLDAVRKAKLVNDTVAETPLIVFWDEIGQSPIALFGTLDGVRVEVELTADETLRDRASGSLFDSVGRCTSGPLVGKRLALAPSVLSRWYGFAQTYPETSVWSP